MNLEEHKELIKKHYEEYKKIGYVECPAFDGEKVYFNKHGFGHLIRKGKVPRTRSEQIKRINLIPNVILILRKVNKIHKCTLNEIDGHPALFWPFDIFIGSVKTRIIVRQLGYHGRKHFYSVMDDLT